VTHEYRLAGLSGVVAAGAALSNNDLHQRQQGRGTNGTDFDRSPSSGTFGRDLHYRTNNIAAYLENALRLRPEWSVIPGVRVEHGTTKMRGRLASYDPANTPLARADASRSRRGCSRSRTDLKAAAERAPA
jgi:Fe(3+) dicitrate transport protein